MVDHFCTTNYKFFLRYVFDQDLYYGQLTLDRWRESWLSNVPVNGDIVNDHSAVPSGFDLKRRERTSQGKCAYLMHRCGYSDSPVCDCGFAQQTTTHLTAIMQDYADQALVNGEFCLA
jgi:hypothetical protein